MTERIILSVVALIMLILTIKKGENKSIFLTSGLTFGILITFIDISAVKLTGYIIYMFTALIISLFHLWRGRLSRFEQVTIIISGFYAFVFKLFSIMVWPGLGALIVLSIIPITLYLIALNNEIKKRNEFGFVTIMNTEFILRLTLILKKLI